jgi:hypothetical protein
MISRQDKALRQIHKHARPNQIQEMARFGINVTAFWIASDALKELTGEKLQKISNLDHHQHLHLIH